MDRTKSDLMDWSRIDEKLSRYRKAVMANAAKLHRQTKDGFFTFKPFSIRQKRVLTWWCPTSPVKDYEGIIADGSIRSGKTVCMSLSYVFWAMESFDGQNFGICGKTIGSLRRNVIFWLKLMLKSRGYTVQDRRADNLLIIRRGAAVNFFYLFGGKDERSQDLIQGITLAGCLFDEVALMPQSFVNQATARCSVAGSKWWFNCNPEGPSHWFYTEWIKKCRKKRLLYLHFTMDDNLSLEPKIKKRYEAQYAGVFYERFILGHWAVASGAIYGSCFSIDKNVRPSEGAFDRCFVSVDYGTQNPCVFLLMRAREKDGRHQHYVEREYYYDGRHSQTGQKTDEQYAKDMRSFIGDEKIECIIIDPSAASLIAQLRKDGFTVIPARNAVLPGISAVSVEFSRGDLLIHPSCKNTIREVSGYVWDEKARDHGDDKPVKTDDHTCDALRYGVFTDIRRHPAGYRSNTYRG